MYDKKYIYSVYIQIHIMIMIILKVMGLEIKPTILINYVIISITFQVWGLLYIDYVYFDLTRVRGILWMWKVCNEKLFVVHSV